jgi:hypothetical protein
MSNYFSDKRLLLEKEKNRVLGKLELLDEIEIDFKKAIQNQINISNNYDGYGNVWINSFALLEHLGLEEWDMKRNGKIVDGIPEINKINNKGVNTE